MMTAEPVAASVQSSHERWQWMVIVGMCGGVAGALNAWLCYAGIPTRIPHADFHWHVVPAGALHGSVLAAVAFRAALWGTQRTLLRRLMAAPAVAWVAGFVSWMPLNRSAIDNSWLESVTWPFGDTWASALIAPFAGFGLVALLFYVAITMWLCNTRRLVAHVALGSAAGVLGSALWWLDWDRWHFSLLHGTIWGTCVGFGVWWAARGHAFSNGEWSRIPSLEMEATDDTAICAPSLRQPDWNLDPGYRDRKHRV